MQAYGARASKEWDSRGCGGADDFTSWVQALLCCTAHDSGAAIDSMNYCEIVAHRPNIGDRVKVPQGWGDVVDYADAGNSCVVKVGNVYSLWYFKDDSVQEIDPEYTDYFRDGKLHPAQRLLNNRTGRAPENLASQFAEHQKEESRSYQWLDKQVAAWKTKHSHKGDADFDPDAPLLGPCVHIPQTVDDRAPFYADLGLIKGSSLQNVQRAALVMARRHDPLRAGSENKFYRVLRAYDALVRSLNEAVIADDGDCKADPIKEPPSSAEAPLGNVIALAPRTGGLNGRFHRGESGFARFTTSLCNEVEIVWPNGTKTQTAWPNASWYDGTPYAFDDDRGRKAFGEGITEGNSDLQGTLMVESGVASDGFEAFPLSTNDASGGVQNEESGTDFQPGDKETSHQAVPHDDMGSQAQGADTIKQSEPVAVHSPQPTAPANVPAMVAGEDTDPFADFQRIAPPMS